jgi:Peptidase family M1 domain/Secretion system C-terminal sorting domain
MKFIPVYTSTYLYCFLSLLFTFFTLSINAQSVEVPNSTCRYNHGAEHVDSGMQLESTGTSGTGANIDVLYHKIFWRINPDSTVKYIKGSVQTNFKTIEAGVSTISFDLRSTLIIDSIKFRNLLLPAASFTHAANIVTINLGVTLSNNFIDSLVIFYQGAPPAVSGAAQGYQRATSSTAGNYITTLSESYEDRDWWPCKHDMQDKIDSLDITVSVPWASPSPADTFWVACNGKMVDSTIVGNSRFFTFKNRYPMATYLVFVSVARFDRHYRSVNVNGTNVQVVYNLLRGKPAATISNILTAMDRMNLVLQVFSNKFSDYPFKNEKHGYYDGLLGAGGMEHQTFSGMATNALTSTGTLVHELMHQWFGDNVTFSTWNDLWLAEGFANYGESLAAELVPSLGQNAFAIRNSGKNSALSSTVSAWIPNGNTTTSNLIWSSSYGSAVYTRGGMVVSMLRAIAGDTKFFQALTNFQLGVAGKSATTDTLKNYFNAALGRDITPFFNDYVGGSGSAATAVGGRGNPINNINWNTPLTNKLVVQVASQTQSTNANVSYFRGPVVLHVKGALPSQDTTINFFDWGAGNLSYAGNGLSAPIAGNLLTYDLSFTPTIVLYDDSARTLSTGSTTFVPTLGAAGFSFNNPTVATATCVAPTSMSVSLSTNALNGFTAPITLTPGSGVPAGATVSFSVNPITPGATTVVTLNNSNTLAPGTYNISLQGTATGANNQTVILSFVINASAGPAITSQPTNVTVCEDAAVLFSIAANTATSFQWQVSTNGGGSWANVNGANSSSLPIPSASIALNGNLYRCQASTICGSTLSNSVSLVVNSSVLISTQPTNAVVCAGQSATFCVQATGSNLVYQWQMSPGCLLPFTNVATATNSCLTITNASLSAAYRCVVTSSSCSNSLTTNCVTLTVNSGVTISTQPTDVEVCSGTTASFVVATNSTQAANYQWQVSTDAGANFSNISGATNASLSIANTTVSLNNNRYRCLVSNASCTTPTISDVAKLTVRPMPSVTLNAAPYTVLSPGQTTTLSASTGASSGGVITTNWFFNSNPLNVTGSSYVVTINQIGSYYVIARETYGSGLQCNTTSSSVVINADESNKLFIYPSPNNGSFNIAYYNANTTSTKHTVVVYDAKAALVYKNEFSITGSFAQLPIKLRAVSSGDYFVVVYDATNKKLLEGRFQVK